MVMFRSSNPPRKGSRESDTPDELAGVSQPAISELSRNGQCDLQPGVSMNVRSFPGSDIPGSFQAKRNANFAFGGDRRALVEALIRRDERAAAAFFDEYGALVERTIARILGADADLADATQDTFMRTLRSIHRLRDPQAMTEWVIQIAVCTASDWVRRRQRKHWLSFRDPADLANYPTAIVDAAGREALRATYSVLNDLNIEERAAFALRYIDGMELKEVALACNCSLATIKRRLARAKTRFESRARKYPALHPWLSEFEPEEAGK